MQEQSPKDFTHHHPREGWYEKGDLITLYVDEGTRIEDKKLRDAQMEVFFQESKNQALVATGESPIGPYQWVVHILAIDRIEVDPKTHFKVIAKCGGGDSSGFGYDWLWDEERNKLVMSEDLIHSIPIGMVEKVPASVISDIERIDNALDSFDPEDSSINVEIAMDALHDARTGLLYLTNVINELRKQNER
jgi:hypothetical protein